MEECAFPVRRRGKEKGAIYKRSGMLGSSPGGSREFEAGTESAIKEGLIRNLKGD